MCCNYGDLRIIGMILCFICVFVLFDLFLGVVIVIISCGVVVFDIVFKMFMFV